MGIRSLPSSSLVLVYTKAVANVLRTPWSATQTWNSSAIHLPALLWISRASFPSFLKKKRTIWCWLSTGLVYTKTIIKNLSEWWIFFKYFDVTLFQPESYYHGTVNIGDTMAIGIQKYEAATKIEKLFYECTWVQLVLIF